ncbi:scaffold protein Nfu/NifU N terminal-domain-containing protein [Limtongia smithiae]|uniref:scaffold protein Nfu/NifU N terminal-domain-containing protein n=1 Tax=Limtongia smithiae TaxID=1125753 RepID=UPI0034CF481D
MIRNTTGTFTRTLGVACKQHAARTSRRTIISLSVISSSIRTHQNAGFRGTPMIDALRPFVQSRSMFIQTATTPNEDALKFIPSMQILPPGARTIEFLNGREAHASPLARKLFSVDGVVSVMFGPDFITVEKDHDTSWAVLKPELFSLLTEFLSSGAKILLEDTMPNEDTMPQDGDSETVSMVKELIDTRIRPAIQEDGGDIEYMGFTPDGVVQLRLRGACRSCDSSAVTLKNGIEAMLMHYVDGVTGIEQVLAPEEEISLKEFQKFEAKLKESRTQL